MKFFLSIICISICTNLSAQIPIKGTVVYNNEPLESTTVYLNNTTYGTITNKTGEFNLSINEGVYELIISHIGFKTITHNLDTSTYNNSQIFSLTEENVILDEVVVKAKKDTSAWEHNFAAFKRQFIGRSEFSKDCKILNPEVLLFNFDAQNDIFTVDAKENLHIKNEALGYEIYFDLEYFSKSENKIAYMGYSYFIDLKGGKSKKRRWAKNRLKAYNGSPIHFYKSVLKNNTKEEGFIIHKFERKENKDRPSQEEIDAAHSILRSANMPIILSKQIKNPKNAIDSALVVLNKKRLPKYVDSLYESDISLSDNVSSEKNNFMLQFEDNLMIVYAKEKEEEGYILRNPFSKPRKALSQTSNIIPLVDKSILYSTGILAQPLDVLYEGYWSYEKISHLLPLDYTPN